MHAPVLVTPPAAAPISLDEVKAQIRADGADEDALLTILIAAAVAYLDGWSGILGRCLVTQTWSRSFDDFSRCMRLPMPASAISSIEVLASDGTPSTVLASNYTLQDDELGSLVRFKDSYSFPSDLYETKAVSVTFTAGFGAAAAVPADLKIAMLMLIGHWFANRETVNIGNITSSLPFGFDAMVSKYRRVGF